MKAITWSVKQVEVSKIKPTPNNYKIKTDLGKARLSLSLKKFGLAGSVVVNTDLCLIDGNSRLEEARAKGQKKIWASMPDRKLSPGEFKEMAAMFDFAKAGEVDMDRIEADLGTTKKFYEDWKLNVPMHLLDKIGKSDKSGLEYPEGSVEGKQVKESENYVSDIKMVQLFFSTAQEKEFRKLEKKFMERFKTANTTLTVLKVMQKLK